MRGVNSSKLDVLGLGFNLCSIILTRNVIFVSIKRLGVGRRMRGVNSSKLDVLGLGFNLCSIILT